VILAGALVDDGAIWFALDPSSSATITTLRGTDLTTDIGVLHLDGHVVPPSSALAGIDTERARCVATALCASAASGTVRWCVDAVTTHLRTREQFGKPIGTFQALQHQAAMLLVNAELATAAAWDAVRAAKESLPQNQIAAAGAALMTVIPAPEVVLDALTMFGAIGFTWEHDLHLWLKRGKALELQHGDADLHRRRIADWIYAPA
jgi:alkylation response protein AidB-like acyl-CoA dehydrogenase